MPDDDDLLTAITATLVAELSSGGSSEQILRRFLDSLRRTHGGRRYYLPSIGTEDRDRRILEYRRSGMTVAQIAERVGVHPATVSRVITRINQSSGFGREDWVL